MRDMLKQNWPASYQVNLGLINVTLANQSLKPTLRTRRRFSYQVSTDLHTTYDTKLHFKFNRAPRPQKHSQRGLVPVR